jgi:hypothetical protein
MVIATSYPFLDIFWTMLLFFAWVIFIWIAITVLIDLFRRDDISGWGKAGWVVLIIIVPFLGVLIYLIAYHTAMADRSAQHAAAAHAAPAAHATPATTAATAGHTGSTGGAAHEIEKAKQLLDSGVIDQAEFDALKAKALG